ncbi:uncharacterized protein LOC119688329 [Teleopsis dalmanni]|uniref:uncharacterized protein LOC119688329 n=1 Tax=Teleopsis dalmanni TaxID=139649 RepID=UPI0018CD8198|nr:uncharacterized protein LOC119688329 [Teleopsis dalmanni]
MAKAGKKVSDQISEAAQVADVIGTPIQFSQKCKRIIEAIISDLNVCDMKWSLFVTAVQNSDNYKRMLPYLPGFVKNHTHLMTLINDVPYMYELYSRLLKQTRSCQKFSILLVHWVLFELNLPTFQSLSGEDINELLTKLPQNHASDKPTHIFKVNYDETSEEEKLFKARTGYYPTKHTFFGCATDNLFEILSGGFKEYRDSGNNGIPFNSECTRVKNDTPRTLCSDNNSTMGESFKAVALCEFIERKEYIHSRSQDKDSYIHIHIPDMIRIRYVFFYCENVKEIVEELDPIEENVIDKFWKSSYFLPVTGCAIAVSVLAFIYREDIKKVLYSISDVQMKNIKALVSRVCTPSDSHF